VCRGGILMADAEGGDWQRAGWSAIYPRRGPLVREDQPCRLRPNREL